MISITRFGSIVSLFLIIKNYESKIDRLEKAYSALCKNRKKYYCRRASYMQKAKISKIFFLNMFLDNKKGLHIAVKPIFE
jgi:hypothetical protein